MYKSENLIEDDNHVLLVKVLILKKGNPSLFNIFTIIIIVVLGYLITATMLI